MGPPPSMGGGAHGDRGCGMGAVSRLGGGAGAGDSAGGNVGLEGGGPNGGGKPVGPAQPEGVGSAPGTGPGAPGAGPGVTGPVGAAEPKPGSAASLPIPDPEEGAGGVGEGRGVSTLVGSAIGFSESTGVPAEKLNPLPGLGGRAEASSIGGQIRSSSELSSPYGVRWCGCDEPAGYAGPNAGS